MKTRFLLFCLLLSSFSLHLCAGNICVNGIYYEITSDSTARVAYTANNKTEYVGSIVIPDRIKYKNVRYNITEIAQSALYSCSNITSLTIGDNVSALPYNLCAECSRLKSVTIGKNVKDVEYNLFDNCSSLRTIIWNAKHCNDFNPKYGTTYCNNTNLEAQITSFVIGDGVEYLPAGLCKNMSNLSSIVMPNTVKAIGSGAFRGCTSLSQITLSINLTNIGGSAFYNCSSLSKIDIPHSLYEIGPFAFSGCTSLSALNLPESLSTIGANAFENCSRISTFTIPYGVETIGKQTFMGCSSLTSIVWRARHCADFTSKESLLFSVAPYSSGSYLFDLRNQITSFVFGDSVEYIPAYLCYGMSELTELFIPNSVKEIGDCAFYNWRALRNLHMSDSIESIGSSSFENCTRLENIVLPSTLIIIGSYAFKNTAWIKGTDGWENGARYLNTILIETNPNEIGSTYTTKASTTTIAANAFLNCQNLLSITLTDSIRAINEYAFKNCTSLQSVIIPDSVEYLRKGAFYDCSSMTSIKIGKSIRKIDDYAFYGCSALNRVNISDLSAWCNIAFGTAESYDVYGCTSNPLIYAKRLYLENQEITTLIIPNDVDSISQLAFYYCTGIQTIVVPPSLKRFCKKAFNGYSISRVYIEDLSAWCKMEFDSNPLAGGAWLYLNNNVVHNLSIPSDVDSIPNNAFYNCKSIKSVAFPDNLHAVGSWAFLGCNLDSIYIPDQITEIGESAFCGNLCLKKVSIGNGLSSIPKSCFASCSQLINVKLGENVEIINYEAFRHCDNLKNIKMNPKVHKIGEGAFAYCGNLKEIEIPYGITFIERDAFSNTGIETVRWNAKHCGDFDYPYYNSANTPFYCQDINVTTPSTNIKDQIKQIVFGEDVEYIPRYLCSGLENLQEVIFPNNVTAIGGYSFSNCSKLKSITFGNNIQQIDDYAFRYCSKIQEIYAYMKVPPAISSNTFGIGTYKGVDLFIPSGTKNVYETTDIWKDFYIIEGLPDVVVDGLYYSLDSINYTATLLPPPFQALYSGIPQTLEIPSLIKSHGMYFMVSAIARCAFKNDTTIQNLHLPNTITEIGDSAFFNSKIKHVTIGVDLSSANCKRHKIQPIEEVTCLNIRNYAFAECLHLNEIFLFKCIDEIWDFAFNNDSNIVSVHAVMDNPPIISDSVFQGCGQLCDINLFVPENLLDIYRLSDVWKEFKIRKEAIYHTVTFIDWDGTIIAAIEVEEGMAVTPPQDPVREGYTFIGWDKVLDRIEEDLIVNALYEKIILTYVVIFNNWDGEELLKLENVIEGTIPVYEGDEPTRSADESYNYKFSGWTPEIVPANADAIYTASFEAIPIDNEGIESIYEDKLNSFKILRDGGVSILRNGKIYSLTGQEIK